MNSDFSRKLKKLMKERKISRRGLARRVHVTPAAVRKWLSGGGVNQTSLLILSNILGVEPSRLQPVAKQYPTDARHPLLKKVDAADLIPKDFRSLRTRILAKTDKRGDRAQLARDLKFYPQKINDWLHGRAEPGADSTLKLLRWLLFT